MPDEHPDEALDIANRVKRDDILSITEYKKLAQAYIDARRCDSCDKTMLELIDDNDDLEVKLHKIVNGPIADKATVAECEARVARYEAGGQKCNSGHVNHLPLKLWHCPMCADGLVKKIVTLMEIGNVLKKAAVLNGTGTWAKKEGVDVAIKRWEDLER